MKKLIMVFLGIIAFYGCYGQRYQVWVNPTANHNYETKGYYRYSNDSILTIYSKSTLFTPSKDFNLRWDKINDLNIRNKSKNDFGAILGAAIGALTSYLIYESGKMPVESIVLIPILTIGGGALTGHLLTCAKISIPLNGKTAKEKSQALRNRINK